MSQRTAVAGPDSPARGEAVAGQDVRQWAVAEHTPGRDRVSGWMRRGATWRGENRRSPSTRPTARGRTRSGALLIDLVKRARVADLVAGRWRFRANGQHRTAMTSIRVHAH